MPLKDDPDLEDALDGLANATRYCHESDLDELGREVFGLYQRVAEESPEGEWDPVPEDFDLLRGGSDA